MERHGRGKGKQKLLGSHQKCWIWGRNAVLETLEAGRWPILDLQVAASLPPDQLGQVRQLAQRLNLPVAVCGPEELTRLCHTTEHQGYVARMTEFPYGDCEAVLASLGPAPFVVILDGVQDPYNFGAIVRSAEIFGAEAVIIGERGQVGVTSMVVRSSAGAVNRIPIARTADLVAAIRRLQERSVQVVAASEKASRELKEHDFRKGSALVVGNEGEGPSPAVLEACAAAVRIPQCGKIGSLNAAVAAGIFFYEIRRQRGSTA